jgi:hypothetical protein
MIRRLLALLILTLAPAPAAALDSASVTPATAYVQGTGTALVTVRWTVQITVPFDQTLTVTSEPGTLVAGSQPPVAAGGTLRRTLRLTAGTHQVRITERLRIDRTAARFILEDGSGTFTRIFTDTLTGTGVATVVLQGRTSGSGGLTLQNLDLSFDDGADFRAVRAGEALTARASLATSGRGLIRGKWEIAGPQGGFRTLSRVSLAAGGPKRSLIESPPLPTDRPGSFRLRFVIDGDGTGGLGDEVIFYTVGSGEGLPGIALMAPAEGAALGTRTRFAWSEVAGAARYRVEFLNETDTRALAAVETADPAAVIRSFTLDRLTDKGPLTWRVLALDAAGLEIARSPQRRIGGP